MKKMRLSDIGEGLRSRIESLGYDYVGFESIEEAGRMVLRVYIDLPGGVNLSDCEKTAREINLFLDENESSLPNRYFLEVSSPGIERPLFSPEDYEMFFGRDAQLVLKGGRKISGVIKGVNEAGNIIIFSADGEISVPFTDIRKGKLIFKEKKGQKKTFKKIKKKK